MIETPPKNTYKKGFKKLNRWTSAKICFWMDNLVRFIFTNICGNFLRKKKSDCLLSLPTIVIATVDANQVFLTLSGRYPYFATTLSLAAKTSYFTELSKY